MCEYAIFFGIDEIPGLRELVEENERSAADETALTRDAAHATPGEKPSINQKRLDTEKFKKCVE